MMTSQNLEQVLFGDDFGLEIFEKTVIPRGNICAIVTAKNKISAIDKAKELSKKYGICHLIHPYPKQEEEFSEFCKKLEKYNPKLFFVNSYSQVLPNELLTIPKIGCFNIHGGILPNYRGGNVLNWVLINGEKETGVTLHKMTRGIDEGPIVLLKKLNIDFKDTVISLRDKLKILMQQVVEEFIPMFEKGKIILYPQDEKKAKYWHKRIPEDGLFNWGWEEEKIYNLIRALIAPWPGAFTYENGTKKIYDKFLNIGEIRKIKNEKNSCYSSA